MIVNKIRTEFVMLIKKAILHYYPSIILNTSHKEQLSLINIIVQITITYNNVKVSVDEYIYNFLLITLKQE